MHRRKPIGWPNLMTVKRLKSGAAAYYWSPPTRCRLEGCPISAEPLGTDYADAKRKCDEVLNPQYRAWLRRDDPFEISPRCAPGTFDWLAGVYKASPQYTELPEETRTSGSNLTFESRKGFPTDSTRASLAHANRNFHHS